MKSRLTAKRLESATFVCTECGRRSEPAKVFVEGVPLRGWRCRKCGYEAISQRDLEKALALLRAKKQERMRISKRGNSVMVTLPKAVVEALDVRLPTWGEVSLLDPETIVIKVRAGRG
ncbi:MAG TPA: hypothetical protein VI893_07120 [Thermoplasmata archaeon]|nr:hypothetical protein [Thermoplasmata archaeon]